MLLPSVLPLLLLIGSCTSADDGPVVEMHLGRVRGFTETSRSGREYFTFHSIPFAKPPVGELRFKAPEPAPLWRGVREAKTELPICMQYNQFMPTPNPVIGIEDCLYLSVFTRNISGSSPVLVHFHGGGFVGGFAKLYRADYLMDGDIVVVNANYRIGILGFLSFETSEMPGNQGMKDQVMALRWVQQNIASFGGDPNLVTIIGESAGGASVYHHIISPISRGLFHRGIAESGTSYCPWALAPPGFARSRAEKLMTLLNCSTNPEEAMDCIMEKEATEIVSKISGFVEWRFHPFLHFGPVIEAEGPNSFIPSTPNNWNHNPVPLLMGMTSAEGLFDTFSYLAKDFDFPWFSDNYDRLAALFLMYFASASNPELITKEIRKFYLPNKVITINEFANLTEVASDSVFNIGIIDGANNHKGDVYFFLFDHVSKSVVPPGMDKKFIIGVPHAMEVGFIWNITFPNFFPGLVPEDVELSKTIVKIVINFAKNGVPNVEGMNLKLNKWTPKDNNYVHIDSKGFHLKKSLFEERYKFWKNLNYRDKMDTVNSGSKS